MTDAAPHATAAPTTSPLSRTYLFALTDGGGTVPPELGVVRRLVDRGHRVTVLADESMGDQVRRTGAALRVWTWKPPGEFRDWDLGSPGAVASAMAEHMIVGPAPDQARQTAAAIDEIVPDLVLTSAFALGAMIAAEARGIPFDVLMPNAYPLPAKGMPPFGAGLSPARGPLGRLRDRIASAVGARFFDRYTLERANAVRADFALAPITTLFNQMQHARTQLILTSAAFDFPAEMPANARYVGPILDDPAWAADAAWEPPPGTAPLVLVALSSTFQNQADCLQRITDALGSLPVRGIVTTGPTVAPEDIRAPAHVVVVESAPHSRVMSEADLVVTHGGHGTVIKTLAAGLPLVILHHGRDQADNAVRVTDRGAGIAISRRSSPRRIARAVQTVLGDPRYRAAARRLGEAVAADAAKSTLIDEVEHFA